MGELGLVEGKQKGLKVPCFCFLLIQVHWTDSVWHLKALVFWQRNYERSNEDSNWERSLCGEL
jgi:hypothetical protein